MPLKTTLFAFAFVLTFMTNCQPKQDDPEILKQILLDYFDGIKYQDLDKLNSLTTKDFVLFEHGMIWTNDSLVRIKDRYETFDGNWTLNNFKINVDQSSGDATYFNHGLFIFNDSIEVEYNWLESATFRKVDGEWKMNFLHSTRRN